VRLVYLGTPAISVPPLRALVADGHDVALVVSAADKRRGRGGALSPSPVKAAALELGLPVTDRVDDALDAGAELGVVVAFGRIIKPHVLAALPMVNVHFSLLPRWRGAAPVERAILAGDDRTGVDLMVVAEGLDEGEIYDRAVVPIGPDDTADDLRARLVEEGTELLLDNLRRGLPTPAPQEGEATYAHKIDPGELRIDWSRPALDVHRLVRVGGAWTTREGKRLKVLRTALPARGAGVTVPAGDEPIELLVVQPEGKAPMEARAWANGARWRDGERLGT
jgi:methionyl-tRNA formyltransferase